MSAKSPFAASACSYYSGDRCHAGYVSALVASEDGERGVVGGNRGGHYGGQQEEDVL